MRDILVDSGGTAMLHHGMVSTNKLANKNKWMMAGQSQVKTNLNIDIDTKIEEYLKKNNSFDSDELFLAKYVWPKIKEDARINIERRALSKFKKIMKSNNDAASWMKEKGADKRIITNLTKK